MRTLATCVMAVLTMTMAGSAAAQDWSGLYVGGSIGGARPARGLDDRVEFDTNLDGSFGDVVRTAAGADAFSPGFCAGAAMGATPAMGCEEDSGGIDAGGRVGYDWRFGRLVVGAVGDVARVDAVESVTAFSTTPAFYTFTRELDTVIAARGRIGVLAGRVLAYATGGVVGGRVQQAMITSNRVNTFVPVDAGEATWERGAQAGAGVEVAVGSRVTAFAEYLHTRIDSTEASTVRSRGPAPATNPFILVNASGTDLRRTGSLRLDAFRAGLHLRF